MPRTPGFLYNVNLREAMSLASKSLISILASLAMTSPALAGLTPTEGNVAQKRCGASRTESLTAMGTLVRGSTSLNVANRRLSVGKVLAPGEVVFYDCSAESPTGRRSVCYDGEALRARKEHKPKTSAMDMAAAMGIEILTEEQYRELQTLGEFDTKTSSWVKTPPGIRERGGAIFCDRRYDHVFTYHNGAESYYAARGFRGALKI